MEINNKVKWLTFTALFMSMNIVLSSVSIPVPGGHLYLNDIVICTAAIILDPLAAFLVGGVGAFLGDMIFYPAPMFVSLVTHGVQAFVISLCVNKVFKNREEMGAVIGVTIGVIIMVTGYTLGRAFVYSTIQAAIIKLPFEFLQGMLGAVCGVLLCYKVNLKKRFAQIAIG